MRSSTTHLSDWSREHHLRKMAVYVGDCAQPVRRRNRHQEPLRERIAVGLLYAGVYGAALASVLLLGVCVFALIWVLLAIGRAIAGGG